MEKSIYKVISLFQKIFEVVIIKLPTNHDQNNYQSHHYIR